MSGWAYVAIASFAFAGLDAGRKQLAASFPPGKDAAMAMVTLLTVGVLPLFGALWFRAGGTLPPSGYWPFGIGLGVLMAGSYILFFGALQRSPLSLTIPLLALTPVFALGIGALVRGAWVSPVQLGGMALVVGGAMVLYPGGIVRGLRSEVGSRMMLGVALLWGSGANLDVFALRSASVAAHAFIQTAVTGVVLLVILGARRKLSAMAPVRRAAPVFILCLALLAVAVLAQLRAILDVEVALIEAVKRSIGLIASVVLGRLLFTEPITTRKLAAITAMSAGVFLLALE